MPLAPPVIRATFFSEAHSSLKRLIPLVLKILYSDGVALYSKTHLISEVSARRQDPAIRSKTNESMAFKPSYRQVVKMSFYEKLN